MNTTVDPFAALNTSTATAGTTKAANEAGSAERFLKLLVTQMQNQDPLNPMDNAQITSQMAQINTVNGISTLNTTVEGLNKQFVQLQALQGASLVGREVTLAGNRMVMASVGPSAGQGRAGFELSGAADRVKVEVLGPSGRVVDSVDLGAQSAGTHSFGWNPPADVAAQIAADGGANYKFRVLATAGSAAVANTALMRDLVQAVTMVGDQLQLETVGSGVVPYSAVKAFN
jgi:flagellar basal-body rod modification protein FlgD